MIGLVRWLIYLGVLFIADAQADIPTPEQECRYRNAATCEINQVTYQVEGPCPPTARTLRPAGRENCAALVQSTSPQPANRISREPATPVQTAEPAPSPNGSRYLRLLALVVVAGLVLIGVGYMLLRNRGALRQAAGTLATWLVALALATAGAYASAGWVFRRIFGRFDNHDSAAPALLAMPVAGLTFVLVLAVLTPVLALLFRTLLRRLHRQSH